jgi:hypothetical protein
LRRFVDHYIFQMRLSEIGERAGWVTTSEAIGDLDQYTPYFTVPWSPALEMSMESPDYLLLGKRGDQLAAFRLQRQGDLLAGLCDGVLIRLMLKGKGPDVPAPLPYVGSRLDLLAQYGLTSETWFVPLIPIDLDKMDQLFLESRVVFVGVTLGFGPHVDTASGAWQAIGVKPPFTSEMRMLIQLQPQTDELLHIGRATDLLFFGSADQRHFLLDRLRAGDRTLMWFVTYGKLIQPQIWVAPSGTVKLIEEAADVLLNKLREAAHPQPREADRSKWKPPLDL